MQCFSRLETEVAQLNNVLLRDLGERIAQGGRWPLVLDPGDIAQKLIQPQPQYPDGVSVMHMSPPFAPDLTRYSGSSLLNFFRSGDMEPERIRVALLTMLRGGCLTALIATRSSSEEVALALHLAGGVLALDLHNFGAGVGLDLLSQPFENVRENLFQDICSRALLQVPKGKRMPNFYDLVTKARNKRVSGTWTAA